MKLHTVKCHICNKKIARYRKYPFYSCKTCKEDRRRAYAKEYKKTYYKNME